MVARLLPSKLVGGRINSYRWSSVVARSYLFFRQPIRFFRTVAALGKKFFFPFLKEDKFGRNATCLTAKRSAPVCVGCGVTERSVDLSFVGLAKVFSVRRSIKINRGDEKHVMNRKKRRESARRLLQLIERVMVHEWRSKRMREREREFDFVLALNSSLR